MEKKIGFKKLTDADLGLNTTGNQTHIGLYARSGMLSFLDDEDITASIFIYGDKCEVLPCLFDRIMNPNGTFRSPKIRMGEADEPSITRRIREIAKVNPNKEYYLLWFALDNNDLLFWLFDKSSADYQKIHTFFKKENKVYDVSQIKFSELLVYINQKVNKVSINIQEEMEIAVQKEIAYGCLKNKDIEKVNQYLNKIGRLGEELIDEYFSRNNVTHEWVNKNRESGNPFDFILQTDGREQYVDVKATPNTFDLPIFFSGSELRFISNTDEDLYSVYRVFNMKDDFKKFRICNGCLNYVSSLTASINDFSNQISNKSAKLQDLKICFSPTENVFKSISLEIGL